MINKKLIIFGTVLLFLVILISSPFADDSVCARVKIEIQQELTLERQAFDARMRINNGLSNITLENVDIDVSFSKVDNIFATFRLRYRKINFFTTPYLSTSRRQLHYLD